MTGSKFKMVFDNTEIKMGVAYEGEFSLGLYALVSVEDESKFQQVFSPSVCAWSTTLSP